MESLTYIKWFVEENGVELEDNIPITCYRLAYEIDENVFCEWALHIRKQYESDDELKKSVSATGLSIEEYLRKFIIPQTTDIFGPTSRSNDFTEIMISDLLEYVYEYSVPRCKQRGRFGKTSSEHGSDIIAYKFYKTDKMPSDKDKLFVVEVKAGLSSSKYTPITSAVTDSHKYDELRHALTLNCYRKKLNLLHYYEQEKEIVRFQTKSEHDYIITYIAAAIISRDTIKDNVILGVKGDELELRKDNMVFLVHGEKLMDLANKIFERCIK
jgi:hypothetical protein